MAQTLFFLVLCFLGAFAQLSDDQIQQILQSHNTARARFGSPPLVWNQTLAQIASDWASGCNAGFNDKLPSTIGENLAIRVDNTAPVFYPGIVDWLDQEQLWTCSTSQSGDCNGGDGPCYMWLQVIWKDTTQIGCAFQQCDVRSPVDGFSFWSFFVCDYSNAALIFNKEAPAVSTCTAGNGNADPSGNGGNADPGNADPSGNQGNSDNGQGNNAAPTSVPTSAPTAAPTQAPTSAPTAAPTSAPVSDNGNNNAPAGTGSSFSDADVSNILSLHNADRARYGSAALVWNSTIAKIAQDFASQCQWGSNPNLKQQCGNNGCGENIAVAAGADPKYTTWSSQESSWICSTSAPGQCQDNQQCGNFQQIVWKDTRQIGCGVAKCSGGSPLSGFNDWNFLVCDYADPGNFEGVPAVTQCPDGAAAPTSAPTAAPTQAPTSAPTAAPTSAPTAAPTAAPTQAPTSAPVSDNGNADNGQGNNNGNGDNGNNGGNQGNGGNVGPSGTGSSFSDSDVSNILASHNSDRARYGSPRLVWNSTIAKIAQDFASQCKYGMNPNLHAQCGNHGCGENVAVAAGADPKYTTWSSQESSWICSTSAAGQCQAGKTCGNFQQIVWKDTRQIGCGVAKCSGGSPLSGFNDWNFLVCDYADPGNVNGVPAVTQCPNGGAAAPTSAPKAPTAAPTKAPTSAPVSGGGGNVGPAGTGSSFTTDEANQILNSHNADRARYGSPALVWNSTIAKIAQDYVSQCKWGSNSNLKAQCGGSFGCGSNTAASAGTKAPVADPKYSQWVSAEKNWQCSTSGPGTCSTGNCGSFTQVVWKGTTQIGCAKQQCTTGYPDPQWKFWSLMVCYYAEPGNFVNQPAVNKCPSGGSLRNADDDTSSSPALSTGALAGIIVGSVVVAVIVLVAILFLVFRSRSRRNSETV